MQEGSEWATIDAKKGVEKGEGVRGITWAMRVDFQVINQLNLLIECTL